MTYAIEMEELIQLVGQMDREEVEHQLSSIRAGFDVDFTPTWLRAQSVDRLRHVLVALCLQSQQMPQVAAA